MNDMYRTLMDIKKNPILFLGEWSLQALSHFITGYHICLENHKLSNEFKFFEDFQWFIQKKYSVTLTHKWVYIIEFQEGRGEAGVRAFFELLDEYLEVNNLKEELTKND